LNTLKLILVIGAAVSSGLGFGALRGIGAAANEAAEAGLDVSFSNPVLRFLLSPGPAKNLTFVSASLFLLLLVVWIPTAVVLMALPYLVAIWLSVLDSLTPWWGPFAVEFAAMFAGSAIGRRMAARWF